jgi:hypothetical protein
MFLDVKPSVSRPKTSLKSATPNPAANLVKLATVHMYRFWLLSQQSDMEFFGDHRRTMKLLQGKGFQQRLTK